VSARRAVNRRRRVFNVEPSPRGGWVIRERGCTRALARCAYKRLAVIRGRAYAHGAHLACGRAQLVVHRRDGRIQFEYTYGDDRFPPRG